jgi:hypothetical protein
MAGCIDNRGNELAVEGARSGCIAIVQTIYGPKTDKEAPLFERVPNTANDTATFEFIWALAQVSGLASMLTNAEREALGIKSLPPGTQGGVIEVPLRDYVCRGSLKNRSIEGVWRRANTPQVTPYEIPITTHPTSF